MTKKILIIGNSVKEYALARKLAKNNEVFVAPGSAMMKDFATLVDIREDSASELLDFVLENGIDITIPVAKKALKTNIVEIFLKNNQQIFAPSLNSAQIIFDKAYSKKMLYKLKVPTPKFGIFEKQNMAMDYIKNQKTPFVLKTNEDSSAVIITSQKTAKTIIDSIFIQDNQKVIIEDYVWGTPFSFYVITDGYKALPIGSSILYKHSLAGDGGQLTSGMGACIPNYKISIDNEYFIMDNIVYPLIEHFENNNNPYMGIIAVNGILTEEGCIQVLGFDTFFNDTDCSALLEIIDTDILELMQACIIGSFSDEIEFIPQKELTATSLVLTCKNKENIENIISGLDLLDEDILVDFYPSVVKNRYLELEANSGQVLLMTAFGRTVSTSSQKVYDEAEIIDFRGKYHRKDICKALYD